MTSIDLPRKIRFRDSGPIRVGSGIIGVIAVIFLGAAIAYFGFGYNPPAGPTGIWAFLWFVFAMLLILVGVGQTVIRRRHIAEISREPEK